jgi:hypothetical protein
MHDAGIGDPAPELGEQRDWMVRGGRAGSSRRGRSRPGGATPFAGTQGQGHRLARQRELGDAGASRSSPRRPPCWILRVPAAARPAAPSLAVPPPSRDGADRRPAPSVKRRSCSPRVLLAPASRSPRLRAVAARRSPSRRHPTWKRGRRWCGLAVAAAADGGGGASGAGGGAAVGGRSVVRDQRRSLRVEPRRARRAPRRRCGRARCDRELGTSATDASAPSAPSRRAGWGWLLRHPDRQTPALLGGSPEELARGLVRQAARSAPTGPRPAGRPLHPRRLPTQFPGRLAAGWAPRVTGSRWRGKDWRPPRPAELPSAGGASGAAAPARAQTRRPARPRPAAAGAPAWACIDGGRYGSELAHGPADSERDQ